MDPQVLSGVPTSLALKSMMVLCYTRGIITYCLDCDPPVLGVVRLK